MDLLLPCVPLCWSLYRAAAIFDTETDRVHTELAWSPDTIHWYRIDEGTALEVLIVCRQTTGELSDALEMSENKAYFPSLKGRTVRLKFGLNRAIQT